MSERLKATVYEDATGYRLFIGETEFPWPLTRGFNAVTSWRTDDDRFVLDVEFVVDEVRWVD